MTLLSSIPKMELLRQLAPLLAGQPFMPDFHLGYYMGMLCGYLSIFVLLKLLFSLLRKSAFTVFHSLLQESIKKGEITQIILVHINIMAPISQDSSFELFFPRSLFLPGIYVLLLLNIQN